MICEHASTFQTHSGVRCNECYADAIQLGLERLLWPEQDDPMDWTAERIAEWFKQVPWQSQGCDGFTFCRNNLAKPRALYGYVWVAATLDLDFEMAWLLDVRRTTGTRDEFDEDRQLLFIGTGSISGDVAEFHPTAVPFLGPHPTPADDLRWFAEQVDRWLEKT